MAGVEEGGSIPLRPDVDHPGGSGGGGGGGGLYAPRPPRASASCAGQGMRACVVGSRPAFFISTTYTVVATECGANSELPVVCQVPPRELRVGGVRATRRHASMPSRRRAVVGSRRNTRV